jgi:ABC-2 type transport system permease protein
VSTTAGTWRLVRAIARRDRIRLPVWIAAISALVLSSALSVQGLYETEADLEGYARLARDNAVITIQAGPGYGLDDPSVGAVLVNEVLIWGAIAVALMSIFAVVRHTRAEEESGRAELVRSAPVGRHAPTVAALVVAVAADLVAGAAIAAALVAIGLPAAGSIALGAALAACGVVFAGVAVVAAQLTTGARTALAIASAALGRAFILRAVGDVGAGGVSWASPIGWAHRVRPFADERWWVVGLAVVVAALLSLAGVALASRRDFGGGFVQTRLGPPGASAGLTGPGGLPLRLQRSALAGWAVGLFTIGFFYGVVGDEVEELLAENPELGDFLVQDDGATLTDAFFATSLLVLALLASGFAISSALRLRSEEAAGRAEPILATATGRLRWAGGHVLVTTLGSAVVLLAAGLGAGTGFALVSGRPQEVVRLGAAALVHLPAVLVLAGVTLALFGVAPRMAALAWAAMAWVVVVGLLGEVLALPRWLMLASPFEHVPSVPAADAALAPLAALTAIAVALAAVGALAFRRRDLA